MLEDTTFRAAKRRRLLGLSTALPMPQIIPRMLDKPLDLEMPPIWEVVE